VSRSKILAAALLAVLVQPGFSGWESDPETPACGIANIKNVEAALPGLLDRELGSIPSSEGRAALKFLSDNPNFPLFLFFLDADRADRLGRPKQSDTSVMMSYAPIVDAIVVAHRLLHVGGLDENSFLSDAHAQKRFARTASTYFVHEVSHARERNRQPVIAAIVDDEWLGFYRGYSFLLDALKADPGFDGLHEARELQRKVSRLINRYKEAAKKEAPEAESLRQEVLAQESAYLDKVPMHRYIESLYLGALAESNEAFERMIREDYEELPRLADDPRTQAAKARARRDKNRALAAELEREGQKPGHGLSINLVTSRNAAAFWSNPQSVQKTRAYYARALGKLRTEMDRRRESGELDAWKVPIKELYYDHSKFFPKIR
jgi:hypothetical protein